MATIVDQLRQEISSREAELANLKSALMTLTGGSRLRKAAKAAKAKASKTAKAANTGGKRPGWTPERRAKMEAAHARKAAVKKD